MFRKKSKANPSSIANQNTFDGLREMALSASSDSFEAPSQTRNGIFGVVIDVPTAQGSIALVTFSDGTSSIYTTTGGGIIGGGAHAVVKDASSKLLDQLALVSEEFNFENDGEAPPPEFVRFHVLALNGRSFADLQVEHFWKPSTSALNPVVAASQNLISAMRSVGGPSSQGR